MNKIYYVLAICFALFLVSCQKAEEITITKYFQAMKHDDRETMTAMSVEPKNIKFSDYKIVTMSQPQTSPFELPELLKQEEKISTDIKDQAKKAQELKDQELDLTDAMDGAAGAKKNELKTKADEIILQRENAEKELKALIAKKGDLKKKVKLEQELIKLSTGVEKDQETYEGQTILIRATVNIKLASGEAKDYIFLLRSNTLKKGAERPVQGRVVIVKMGTAADFDK